MPAVLDHDFTAFTALAQPVLAADPVRNTVAGTLIHQVLNGDLTPEPDALWIRVVDDARTVAVALRTPPHPLLLTVMPAAAADVVCDHLLASGIALPGVNGPQALSDAFAERWSARTGVTPRTLMSSRLFKLDELTPPTGVPGELRAATVGDRDQLVAWTAAFTAEAVPGEPSDPALIIDARLRSPGSLWVWSDQGRSASMLWVSAPVAGVVRVSGVYTPPDLRGRGYASACVAAVSARLRAAGRTCVLFTDLANPTSNKIYQAIGYRPVMDARAWALT